MSGLVPFNRRRNEIAPVGFVSFQNMLDDFISDGWPFSRSLAADTFKMDIQETDKAYLIEAELPGVKKEDINISFDDGKLKIEVIRQENKEEKTRNYIHRERSYASMMRSIILEEAASEGTKASLDNGILNIVVPKKEDANRSIRINID